MASLDKVIAAHTSWANTTARGERSTRTAPARAAADSRFLKMARERITFDVPDDGIPDDDLSPEDLRKRQALKKVAEHLRLAHFADMARRSAQSRRRKVATG